jgi:signal transduction histidine kinase
VSDSQDQLPPFSTDRLPGAPDAKRLMGLDLRTALADGWRAAEEVIRHVMPDTGTDRDIAELRRSFAEAEHVADALLDQHTGEGALRIPLDVDEHLAQKLPSMQKAMPTGISLSLKSAATGGRVFAVDREFDGILSRLVTGAVGAMRPGGDLTITTGWLDLISGGWPPGRFWPRRHVRVSVADTGDGNYSETWQRVFASEGSYQPAGFVRENVAEVVSRLGGSIIIESAEANGSRIHVCLPAALDAPGPGGPGSPLTPAA